MVHRDPVGRNDVRFGCRECQYTTSAKTHQPRCPDCGSRMETALLTD